MVDYNGRRFGRLTVISRVSGKYLRCKCDCGNIITTTPAKLRNKITRSCGCLRKEISSAIGSKTIAANSTDRISTDMKYNTNFGVIEREEPHKNNRSGHTGVWFNPKTGRFIAYITVHRKRIYLGSMDTIEDAIKVREEAEEEYFRPLIAAKNADSLIRA